MFNKAKTSAGRGSIECREDVSSEAFDVWDRRLFDCCLCWCWLRRSIGVGYAPYGMLNYCFWCSFGLEGSTFASFAVYLFIYLF